MRTPSEYKSVISIKHCLILRELRMVNRYRENWSAPRSLTMLIALERQSGGGGSRFLFLEEKFLNQEINRNDVDGGEKMASFR